MCLDVFMNNENEKYVITGRMSHKENKYNHRPLLNNLQCHLNSSFFTWTRMYSPKIRHTFQSTKTTSLQTSIIHQQFYFTGEQHRGPPIPESRFTSRTMGQSSPGENVRQCIAR